MTGRPFGVYNIPTESSCVRWNSVIADAPITSPYQWHNDGRLLRLRDKLIARYTRRDALARVARWAVWLLFVGLTLFAVRQADAQLVPAQAPADAVRRVPVLYVNQIKPLANYERWYKWAEACTGLKGNYKKVRWYVTPAPWNDGQHGGLLTYGMWQRGNRITLNLPEVNDSVLVIHEVLHDLASYHRDQFPDSIAHPPTLYGPNLCSREFHP